MSADSPVAARVSVPSRSGALVESPVERFRRQFADPRSSEAYYEWAAGPLSKLVAAVLREYALNQPADVSSSDLAVQYGITLGLSMAAQFISDPSSVRVGGFSGQTRPDPQAIAPIPTYDTDPASVYFASNPDQEE